MWIIGDSYVRRGGQRAAATMGSNLGVPEACVHWFGLGGLRWTSLLPFFSRSLRERAAPEILIIHCGSNDMDKISSVKMVNRMKEDLHQLHHRHPGMKICLSALNQRCRWGAGANPARIDKARKFVNSVMATFVRSLNGAVIEHPHIRHDSPGLFLKDGVHFAPRGNYMFLKSFADCLKDHIQKQ